MHLARLEEAILGAEQFDGEWWLPESPDHVVAGSLTISDEGQIELRLFDSLRSEFYGMEPQTAEDGSVAYTMTTESLAAQGKYPRILGRFGSSGCTLDDCFSVHRTMKLLGGRSSERIHVRRMFKNVHFSGDESLRFSDIVIHVDGLTHWTAMTGMKESVRFQERKNQSDKVLDHTLEIKHVPTKKFSGPDGATFELGHTYRIQGNAITERTFAQDFYFAADHGSLVDLDRLLTEASALQDLISIAIGRPAAFTSVSLRHPGVFEKVGTRKVPTPIDMVAPWTVKRPVNAKPLNHHSLWFRLDDLGGVASLSNWLDVALANRSTLSRVMTTKYAAGMYATDHLFNCAAALEAYDRQSTSKGPYLTRIKRCIYHAGAEFAELVGDTSKWAAVLKDGRNTVAHHNANIVGASTEQIIMGRSAFWLFVLCLFRDAGFPDTVFARIVEHPEWHWLKGQVSSVLADA